MARTRVLKRLLYFYVEMFLVLGGQASADWPKAGANPQRTSWAPEEVKGTPRVNWYRPIEATTGGK